MAACCCLLLSGVGALDCLLCWCSLLGYICALRLKGNNTREVTKEHCKGEGLEERVLRKQGFQKDDDKDFEFWLVWIIPAIFGLQSIYWPLTKYVQIITLPTNLLTQSPDHPMLPISIQSYPHLYYHIASTHLPRHPLLFLISVADIIIGNDSMQASIEVTNGSNCLGEFFIALFK